MLKLFRYVLCVFAIFYLFGPISFDNKTLEPYKIEIMDIIKKHCNNDEYYNPLKQFLYFQRQGNEVIGQCNLNNFYYSITIDPDYWKHFTEDEKFQLVAHEVFHCALGFLHVDNPNNFMYYRMVDLNRSTVISQMESYLKFRCGR
jgi:hypothetical protein